MPTGVALSTFATDPSTTNVVDRATELAVEAARAGIDGVWFGQLYSYSALTLAALVGRAVENITVGTSVVPLFPRHPIHLASAAKTAQAATSGRFQLGVGLGAPALIQATYGVEPPPPIRGLRDQLGALRQLLDGSQDEFHSETVTAASPFPTAVAGAETAIPLIVAAMGPQALRAAGELADGTLPFLAGPKAIREHIAPTIHAAAQAAGRPKPRIIAAVPAVVTNDAARARGVAESATAFYDTIPSYQRVIALNGSAKAADLFVIGDDATVRGGLQAYLDAGATEVIVTQADLVGEEARRETWSVVGDWANG